MNDLQAKLIKQEQAAVLQVVNHDQTQLCTFLSLCWGVNNACQNNHEVDVSLTNKTGSIQLRFYLVFKGIYHLH